MNLKSTAGIIIMGISAVSLGCSSDNARSETPAQGASPLETKTVQSTNETTDGVPVKKIYNFSLREDENGKSQAVSSPVVTNSP